MREEGILLRPVEAVDLVTEEDRAPPRPSALLGFSDDLPHPGYPFGHRAEGDEGAVGVFGDQPRKRRLPDPGRTPEDDAPDVSPPDRVAERLPRPEEVGLPHVLLQPPRPHACGEGFWGGEEGGCGHLMRRELFG